MEKSDFLNLIIEFGGGAELLFGNVKKHNVQLEQKDSSKWTIRKLLPWIQENLLKERPELFIQDESVRPGILVLVNDADWELLSGWTGIFTACKLIMHMKLHWLIQYLDGWLFKAELCSVLHLKGELDYELKNNDNILFISTLHGG